MNLGRFVTGPNRTRAGPVWGSSRAVMRTDGSSTNNAVTPMEQARSSVFPVAPPAQGQGAAVPCGHRLRHDQNACDGGELLVVVVVLSRHFLGGGSQDALEWNCFTDLLVAWFKLLWRYARNQNCCYGYEFVLLFYCSVLPGGSSFTPLLKLEGIQGRRWQIALKRNGYAGGRGRREISLSISRKGWKPGFHLTKCLAMVSRHLTNTSWFINSSSGMR